MDNTGLNLSFEQFVLPIFVIKFTIPFPLKIHVTK